MVGPRRTATVVDAGVRKPLDLKIHVPVESMVEPEQSSTATDPLDPLAGGEATRRSIWPAIYPELLQLVREHRSTIVFVNNRRGAERLALRLNELAEEDIARAHHGSLAREERIVVEEMLKAGELPCLVATSSLELGIDMGAVDLVLQVESPKSVAAACSASAAPATTSATSARAGSSPSSAPTCSSARSSLKLMREGRIEPTVVPRNALDVLAQQIVAIAASRRAGRGRASTTLYALVTRTHSYAELPRELLENVLDMLDGRYPSQEFGELRPRIVWDRVAGTIRARKGARQLAVTNAGTIPDRGLFAVVLPDGRRVGELDEEMVYEARPGQTFLLGASSWRIEEIGRDRVIVSPAPGVPGAVPFWKGDGVGRPKELGRGDRRVQPLGRRPERRRRSSATTTSTRCAAKNLLDFLREQQEATRVVPSDRTIVVERFRDEIGDWRLCVLRPYGGRVHAAWALALQRADPRRVRPRVRRDLVRRRDHRPPPRRRRAARRRARDDRARRGRGRRRRRAVGSSALFGARFRENAGRALLIPRAYPGKRTPLWQQRLKSQSLLEVAKRYADFPIILETYRECLRDVLDVPGLVDLLRELHRRELSLVEVETPTASPFASSLLFDYVATYMYEGDTPNAERRAAALSLDRDLLRELLGQEELRELIDADALEQVEADLQHRSERTRADDARRAGRRAAPRRRPDRRRGARPRARRRRRRGAARDARARAPRGRAAHRRRAALGRRRRRRPVPRRARRRAARRPARGVPRRRRPTRSSGSLRRYARTHGPFTTAELRARYGVDPTRALSALERAGDARPRRAAPRRQRARVVRPRGPAPPAPRVARRRCARRSRPPTSARSRAFLPSWQGVDRHPAAGAGIDRLREVLVPLQGLALPADVWERDVLPRRVGAYSPTWMDQLCAARRGRLGRRGRARAQLGPRRAVLPRRRRGDRPAAATRASRRPTSRARRSCASGSAPSPCFFTDLLAELAARARGAAGGAVGPRLGRRGHQRRLGAAARPAADARPRRSARTRATGAAPAPLRRRGARGAQRAGPGPLVADRADVPPRARARPAPPHARRAAARALRHRHPRAGARRGHPRRLLDRSTTRSAQLETLGVCRRGYFVEGLGGAQFALPGAVERLRAQRADEETPPIVLAATDPAQPYGAALPWPKRDDASTARPQRVAGAYVVLAGAEPVVYVERGGRGLHVPRRADDPRAARRRWGRSPTSSRGGRSRRLSLERVDGEPVVGSDWEPLLVEMGFRPGPRKLTLSA